MNKKGKILGMICPSCGKPMFRHKTTMSASPKWNFRLGSVSPTRTCQDRFHWRCKDCVYMYEEDWLDDDRFNQAEQWVLRKGEDKKVWEAMIKN